ncbi:unnamed protein product, partial [marine sediment metagenome]
MFEKWAQQLTGASGSRVLHATDGTIDAYRRLYDAAV